MPFILQGEPAVRKVKSRARMKGSLGAKGTRPSAVRRFAEKQPLENVIWYAFVSARDANVAVE